MQPFAARAWSHHPPPVVQKTAQRHRNAGGLTNIYDEAHAPALQVRNVSDRGIELQDGLVYSSACILLGGQSFSWRVPGQPWVGWSSEAFEIFSIISPKPGQSLSSTLLLQNASTYQSFIALLLLGTGKSLLLPPPSIREYLRKAGISVDVMDTVSALVVPTPYQTHGRYREMHVQHSIYCPRREEKSLLPYCPFDLCTFALLLPESKSPLDVYAVHASILYYHTIGFSLS